MADIDRVLALLNRMERLTKESAGRLATVVMDIGDVQAMNEQALDSGSGYGRRISGLLLITCNYLEQAASSLKLAEEQASKAADQLMGL